jgi:hypothetical protein
MLPTSPGNAHEQPIPSLQACEALLTYSRAHPSFLPACEAILHPYLQTGLRMQSSMESTAPRETDQPLLSVLTRKEHPYLSFRHYTHCGLIGFLTPMGSSHPNTHTQGRASQLASFVPNIGLNVFKCPFFPL